MTPQQAQVWARYHQATEMLADATDDLIKAHEARRAGLLGNCAEQEEIVIGLLAHYRACRAEMEALR